MIGHIAPEAQVGGNIALVAEGDHVTINLENEALELQISDTELERRRRKWQAPAIKYTRGVLAKYARLVSSAAKGAVTS